MNRTNDARDVASSWLLISTEIVLSSNVDMIILSSMIVTSARIGYVFPSIRVRVPGVEKVCSPADLTYTETGYTFDLRDDVFETF